MTSNLPATRETAEFLRVQPAQVPIPTDSVARNIKGLYNIPNGAVGTHRVWRLLSRSPTPIESLLVAPSGEHSRIDWLFRDLGSSDNEALESTLEALFPDECQITNTTWDLTQIDPRLATVGQTHNKDAQPHVAGVEFLGRAERRKDWQTQLTPAVTEQLTRSQSMGSVRQRERRNAQSWSHSLSTILQEMAQSPLPMIFQVLMRPLEDWKMARDRRKATLESATDTLLNKIIGSADQDELTLTASQRERIEEIQQRATNWSFVVNARVTAIATGGQADVANRTANRLQSAFAPASGRYHEIEGRVVTDSDHHPHDSPAPGQDLLADIRERQVYDPEYQQGRARLPTKANRSRGIIADHRELPQFAVVEGDSVPPEARRALETTPPAQTPIPLPPNTVLEHFRGNGMTLGYPINNDGEREEMLRLPPEEQDQHVLWNGRTKSGKTTSFLIAALANKRATAGPEIILTQKGGEMPRELMQSHYNVFGGLDDVRYFDCADLLPALSFFEIEKELKAGVKKATAVQDRVHHYEEIVAGIMGEDRFYDAQQSVAVIRQVLEALYYTPEQEAQPVTQRRLHDELNRMHERKRPPAVTDKDIKRRLDSVLSNQHEQMFDAIMQGATNRVEAIGTLYQLEALFNHSPSDTGPEFDFAEALDEDVTIIFDMGRLRSEVSRGLTIALLSKLWTALRRRRWRRGSRDLPLANLYIEEAASVADCGLLDQLLSQGREFCCSVTLAMQFPEQMADADERTYAEAINNIGTTVTGNTAVDRKLADRFATEDRASEEMDNRLGALSPGQWLVNLPGEFQGRSPRPFAMESPDLPAGHPDNTEGPPAAYQEARATMERRTRSTLGLQLQPRGEESSGSDEPTADESADTERTGRPSLLEMTNRLPECLSYEPPADALVCGGCGNRFDPAAEMVGAINCCHDIETVDRASIPVTKYNLMLSDEEIRASEWSLKQQIFLQLVDDAHQLRHDPLEYDIVYDSMTDLRDDVAIENRAIDELIDAGLLKIDTDNDHPHRLYTVTDDGREVIKSRRSHGVDVGDGKGDLNESSLHVCLNEGLRRYCVQEYVNDPQSPVTEVRVYYRLDPERLPESVPLANPDLEGSAVDSRIIDIACLDADGNVVVTGEAETMENNDERKAVPRDFDKMAACEPDEAIWAVPTRGAGHELVEKLEHPGIGEPRLPELDNSSTTPHRQCDYHWNGLTRILPIGQLQ